MSKSITPTDCSCTGLNRRHFILAGLSATLVASKGLADGHGEKARLIAGSVKANGKPVSGGANLSGKGFKLVTEKDAAIAAIGGNVFLLSPETEVDFAMDGDNRFSGFQNSFGSGAQCVHPQSRSPPD